MRTTLHHRTARQRLGHEELECKGPKVKNAICVTLALALTACATQPRGAKYIPIIDGRDVDYSRYAVDLQECQQYAAQRDPMQAAMAGALIGALLGAALAPRGHKNDTAGYGGSIGALSGGGRAIETQEDIIKRCLVGRGYSVLD